MDLQEPTTFSRVYAEHSRDVERVARRVLGDPAHAQDVAQEVFERLWRDPRGYRPERGDIGTYLRVLARSRAIDAHRSRAAACRAADRARAKAPIPEPHAEADPAERATLVLALRALPEPQREAVVLVYWGDLADHQVARYAGVPLGTAKSRIRLGLRRLRAEVAVPQTA